jgi:ACS family hexuronate transporter-like MFS transporter
MSVPVKSVGWYRWIICALLFFATTINYVDRAVLSVLEPVLAEKVGWTATQYGIINASFMLAYAIGFLFAGRLMDKIGVRWGYTISLILWSLAAAAHAFASTVIGFAIARFVLGIGESGNFPAAIKTVAEWFPKKDRALATGIFNAGSNIGAVVAPATVPLIYDAYGWEAAFVATGLAGLIWVVFWWPIYRPPQEHPHVSPAELAYIQSDPPDPLVKLSWSELLGYRQTWAFAVGKFLTDAVWWFYLFWFPKFMGEQFDLDIKTIGLPMITVYLLADVGSVFGGYQSSRLMARGWSANAARKTAMLTCALCVVPVSVAPLIKSNWQLGGYTIDASWTAVFLIGIAAAAHQGFSANMFTIASDMFPRWAVGSIVGIGGFAGAMGGFLMNLVAGRVRDITGNYIAMFSMAAFAYLSALLLIHLLAPRLEPVQLPQQDASA